MNLPVLTRLGARALRDLKVRLVAVHECNLSQAINPKAEASLFFMPDKGIGRFFLLIKVANK